jgi:nucleotide-binding universal stress UspA family protein
MEALSVHISTHFKNILYLTDFSPAAQAAEPFAAELTKRYGARLHALHVRPPVINPMTPPESWKGLEKAAEIEAKRAEHKLLEDFGDIQPEVFVNEGDIWQNVEDAVEGCKVDLVVMGTRGRSGIHKLLLGSIAESIFRLVSCPVLTMGPHVAKHSPTGIFTHILFATDFDPRSMAAAYAVSLAKEYQAQLTLLHVIDEPKTGELLRPYDLGSSPAKLLRSLVPPEVNLDCVPDYVVEIGPAAEKILEVAAERKVDLIVLGVRRASGVPGAAEHLPISTAHKVVSQAACPVLTVRSDGLR